MIVERIEPRTVQAAIALATRAPSVHNTQPWKWRIGPRSVHLYADRDRWLQATDPEGRDLVMSCGAVLHHLRVALAAAGLRATVHRLPNPAEPDHLAAVELTPGTAADADYGLVAALERRHTDRRPFASWPVPDAVLAELVGVAAEQGAVLRPVTEAAGRSRLLAAITEAERIQRESTAYRTELALWSGRRAGPDGVPAAAADDAAAGVRRFDGATGGGGSDGAALLVLGTASDDLLSWLRAGEATSAVLLQATIAGLASSPLSQPLEVGGTRMVLRDDVLGGTLSPQMVLRVGWPSGTAGGTRRTPRRPVEETIDAGDG
ncbi:MAG: NAD(P)H nitroreductase [Pseudonocardia sp.]